jgi:Cofactor assembly of complex C subunit B, CCB2/CCB4
VVPGGLSHLLFQIIIIKQRMKATVIIGYAALWLGLFDCSDAFASVSRNLSNQHRVRTTTELYGKESKGVYARPSAAIERGSGFFIPGLEGPRVRLLFGLTVLVLTAVNHVLGDVTSFSLTEALAVGYSMLLLVQAAIEFGKEENGYILSLDRSGASVSDPNSISSDASLLQQWASDSVSTGWKEKVQWSAASYIALTPANTILLLDKDHVIYRLGSKDDDRDKVQEATGCTAAIETLSNAKSGRVSLPATHPAVLLLAPQETRGRCVILQSVNERHCWMVTSEQLIQAFTSQDLRWLGQLASYINE